jgi:hypothetical protein
MPLESGKTVLLLVKSEWSEDNAVRTLLGSTDSGRPVSTPSNRIIAKVIEPKDPLGLWVELYTKKPDRSPLGKPFEVLIPWSAIVTIAVVPESDPEVEELENLFRNSP